jgi:hypothetical protein
VSIVRVGLAENTKFADGYDAIFGGKKKTGQSNAAAKTAKPKTAKTAKTAKTKTAKSNTAKTAKKKTPATKKKT